MFNSFRASKLNHCKINWDEATILNIWKLILLLKSYMTIIIIHLGDTELIGNFGCPKAIFNILGIRASA